MENADLHSAEIPFTQVSFYNFSTKHEFTENTYLLNFTRKRNCLVGGPHADPCTVRIYFSFAMYLNVSFRFQNYSSSKLFLSVNE